MSFFEKKGIPRCLVLQGVCPGHFCPYRTSPAESEPVPPKIKNKRARYERKEPQINLGLPRQIWKNRTADRIKGKREGDPESDVDDDTPEVHCGLFFGHPK